MLFCNSFCSLAFDCCGYYDCRMHDIRMKSKNYGGVNRLSSFVDGANGGYWNWGDTLDFSSNESLSLVLMFWLFLSLINLVKLSSSLSSRAPLKLSADSLDWLFLLMESSIPALMLEISSILMESDILLKPTSPPSPYVFWSIFSALSYLGTTLHKLSSLGVSSSSPISNSAGKEKVLFFLLVLSV